MDIAGIASGTVSLGGRSSRSDGWTGEDHPRIIPGWKVPYLVMERLEGTDLSARIAHDSLSISEAAHYVRQACAALEVAHEAGIAHRDLKPSNLFLENTGGAIVLKVLDFGIAKHVHTSRAEATGSLTDTGAILGSPRYMSPEQVYGAEGIDARTDIWSLGVILYELLTGRVPFPQAPISAVVIAIATEAPQPPRALRPDLPSGCARQCVRRWNDVRDCAR